MVHGNGAREFLSTMNNELRTRRVINGGSSRVGPGIGSAEHSMNSAVKANLSRRMSVSGNGATLSFSLVPDPIYGIMKRR
jgi:hypothetical protein